MGYVCKSRNKGNLNNIVPFYKVLKFILYHTKYVGYNFKLAIRVIKVVSRNSTLNANMSSQNIINWFIHSKQTIYIRIETVSK